MRKKKILLVDDDTLIRDMLIADYDCVSVQNGKEGLSYLDENLGEVDLIITDMMKDGFEMLEHIQNNLFHRDIPVLLETSLEQLQDITRAFDMGVDDIIIKPINSDIVRRRVSNMLDVGDNRLVHNVMEDLIRTEINENIVNLGICPCPICRKDLLTLTLNNVTPKYVSTEKGEIITKAGSLASRDERIKLLAEVTHYAGMIKENPRHE